MRDLYSYFQVREYADEKDISKIANRYELYEETKKALINQRYKGEAVSENLYEDDKWIVIAILNNKAACKLGAEKWCTAVPTSDRYKQKYKIAGDPLYLVVDKENEDVKYQVSFAYLEIRDQDNEVVKNPLGSKLIELVKNSGAFEKYPKSLLHYERHLENGTKDFSGFRYNAIKQTKINKATDYEDNHYLQENTMQIQVTKARLQEMINEELKKVLKEEYRPEDNYASPPPPRTAMYKAKKKIGGAVKSAGQMVGRNLGKLGAAAALGGAMAAAPTAFDKGMDYLERDRAEQTSRMADYEGSMDVNVSDAVESLYSYPEFTDKTTLQAAVETVLSDNLAPTYENVFPEYERILGSSMKESKRNLSLEDLIIKELAKMSIT
jgi:hypothetical protein